MPSFVFNVDQVTAAAAGAQLSTLNINLYANTADRDLVYNGNDPAVWDRVNAERIRRGLPSLAGFGPRPRELATSNLPPTDVFGNAKEFTVSGATLTRDQAFGIFRSQVLSGGLTGFKAGEALSAATQLADGLQGAAGSVLSSTTLPGGIGSLGTQLQASIQGLKNAIVNTPLTNVINVGDYARSVPSFGDLENIKADQVTGSLASANKLVGQKSTLMTNTLGVGKYGLDARQLETAGYLKPGTTAKYLSGVNTLTSVLNSPSVWTGKEGVAEVKDILNNSDLQTKIQQGLMTNGLQQMRSLGVPVDALPPQLNAGLSLAASKDVASAVDWARGQTGAITAQTKAVFDKLAKDASYAVQYVDEKVGFETLGLKEITGSLNTTDRTTLNAAVTRVVGNPKIPSLNFSGSFVDLALEQALKNLNTLTIAAESRANIIFAEEITPQNVDAREAKLRALVEATQGLITQLKSVKAASLAAAGKVPNFVTKVDNAIVNAEALLELIQKEIAIVLQFKAGLQSV